MTTGRPIIAPKKLIEVALPLDDINKASAREKSIRHGHPSTLHLWWARRPLAAARAVLFAQMVNDPSWKYSDEEQKKPQVRSAITRKRNELFKLITELVQWESTTKEEVLSRARAAIRESWRETCEANTDHPDPEVRKLFDPEKLPPFHDPFAGGGSIPLEAQRLGLEAHATDLNPVAVLINKAMIEIPPKFAGRPPVGPLPAGEKQTKVKQAEDWSGARGLAEDVLRYATWMREEASKRIGHLYPKVKITKELLKERPDLKKYEGRELAVIAWLWARTVKSPNPAAGGAEVPLVGSFYISQRKGSEAWIQPIVEGRQYRFAVHAGVPKKPDEVARGTRTGRGANFRCLISEAPIGDDYVKEEAKGGRLGWRLLATIAEGEQERVYLSPTREMERAALEAEPRWRPNVEFFQQALGFRIGNYGLSKWSDLFTSRQTLALDTFAQLVEGVRAHAEESAIRAGRRKDNIRLAQGGTGATAYADAIAIYCGLCVGRLANRQSTNAFWDTAACNVQQVFARQALPMVWDTAEANPFSDSSGNFVGQAEYLCKAVAALPGTPAGTAVQHDARLAPCSGRVISTDPPYYDNIGYADLSDFFYVWLRRALAGFVPELFGTLAVPKMEELVATPRRHGGKKQAEEFFLTGMTRVMERLAEGARPTFPVTIFYAFKQSETENDGTASTGWETFLGAVVDAGFAVTGTWPVRTEYTGNLKTKRNALASSVVIVCRPRRGALVVARKDFLRELSRTLPGALEEMTADPTASIAPVDLAQATIGPGMAIFSKYKSVLEADGSPMTVHNALIHINKAIDDYFAQAEGEMDADTRFCIGWFQQYGFETGAFGEADVLARAKGTSVDGVRDAGVLSSSKGKVRLFRVKDYPKDWDPTADSRVPVWEACHQMCRALGVNESEAGALLARMPDKQDAIRQIAYRLYTLCERKGWAEEAREYNELVTSWPAIVDESRKTGHRGEQLTLI
jgi:putative DNA methylase